MSILEKRMKEASKVWKDHENWQGYLATKGLTKNIPKWNDLYEGRHWGVVTDSTKNMPRPTMPMVKMIVNTKVSNIASGDVEIKYIPQATDPESRQKANRFTKFAKYQTRQMGMQTIDFDCITNDRKDGIFVKHYYWSEEEKGRKGHYVGGLKCQYIDSLSFEVADPTETDIQKQKWINVITREELSAVKDMCDNEQVKELIVADDLETDYTDKVEMEDNDLVTIITHYYKKDGEVYFIKLTKNIQITEETPLNPIVVRKAYKKKQKEDEAEDGVIDEDSKTTSTPDEKLEKNNWTRDDYYMASYYPIEICSLEPSKNSIFGLSEVQDLVVAQNIINTCIAMGALNLLQLGAPKVVADKQALGDQKLNNEPGQMIYNLRPDKSLKDVIDVMPAQPFTAQAQQFAPALIDLTRTLTNSTDIITGDMIGKNVSGITVGLLQERSMKYIEMQRRRFWQHKEREGRILEMFYKLYYENEDYTYEYSSAEKVAMLEQGEGLVQDGNDVFNGEDYQDVTFNVIIEANQGTQFNDAIQLDIINNLLQMNKIETDIYFELLPDSMSQIRNKYKEVTLVLKQSQLNQALALAEEQAMTIEELNEENKQTQDLIRRKDKLITQLVKEIQRLAPQQQVVQPQQ